MPIWMARPMETTTEFKVTGAETRREHYRMPMARRWLVRLVPTTFGSMGPLAALSLAADRP